MFARLVLLFISVPLLETLILIKLGSLMGFWATVWVVIVTGVLGAALARVQGFRVWSRVRSELNQGRMPAGEMVDGLLIFMAGLVLLTPGLLTDVAGFALLIPFTRAAVKAWLMEKLERMVQADGSGGAKWVRTI